MNAWGGRHSGSLASRLAEAEAAKDRNAGDKKAEGSSGKGKKAGKQLVVLGMQNRRY